MTNPPFWENKSFADMSHDEWESLCDGCGKCCVLKLEDADTAEVYYTDIACKLLDCETCRCTDYARRKKMVPDCVTLRRPERPADLTALEGTLRWMPQSCAYRLLHEGKALPHWHPLVTGDGESTRKAGKSLAGLLHREQDIATKDIPRHITDWDKDEDEV